MQRSISWWWSSSSPHAKLKNRRTDWNWYFQTSGDLFSSEPSWTSFSLSSPSISCATGSEHIRCTQKRRSEVLLFFVFTLKRNFHQLHLLNPLWKKEILLSFFILLILTVLIWWRTTSMIPHIILSLSPDATYTPEWRTCFFSSAFSSIFVTFLFFLFLFFRHHVIPSSKISLSLFLCTKTPTNSQSLSHEKEDSGRERKILCDHRMMGQKNREKGKKENWKRMIEKKYQKHRHHEGGKCLSILSSLHHMTRGHDDVVRQKDEWQRVSWLRK